MKIVKGESGLYFVTMPIKEFQKMIAIRDLLAVSGVIIGLVIGLIISKVF